MSCVRPIDAWRAARVNNSGKRGIVFNPRHGFLDQPLQVPCGKCVGCAADRAMIWGIRMHHEASQHKQNCFITLTYRDAPECLNKRDLQLFFKRLRKLCAVRYFACGEYGTVTHRPHYHAVIFGQDFLGGAYEVNDRLYSNPYIDRAWSHGFVSIGSVSLQSCMYVAGYCNKKLGQPDCFNLMSRRPGIGHTWLDKYRDDLVRTETVAIEGKELPIPKRYLEWYADDFEQLKRDRASYFATRTPEQVWKRRVNLAATEDYYKSKAQLNRETL